VSRITRKGYRKGDKELAKELARLCTKSTSKHGLFVQPRILHKKSLGCNMALRNRGGSLWALSAPPYTGRGSHVTPGPRSFG
jgi:hypothetical protein